MSPRLSTACAVGVAGANLSPLEEMNGLATVRRDVRERGELGREQLDQLERASLGPGNHVDELPPVTIDQSFSDLAQRQGALLEEWNRAVAAQHRAKLVRGYGSQKRRIGQRNAGHERAPQRSDERPVPVQCLTTVRHRPTLTPGVGPEGKIQCVQNEDEVRNLGIGSAEMSVAVKTRSFIRISGKVVGDAFDTRLVDRDVPSVFDDKASRGKD